MCFLSALVKTNYLVQEIPKRRGFIVNVTLIPALTVTFFPLDHMHTFTKKCY